MNKAATVDKQLSLQMALGVVIRTRRQSLGLSQSDLAERAGLHRTYLCDIEQGNRNVSIVKVGRLARGLHMTLSELFLSAEDFGSESV